MEAFLALPQIVQLTRKIQKLTFEIVLKVKRQKTVKSIFVQSSKTKHNQQKEFIMANIITGFIDPNGRILQGEGFAVEAGYGYLIQFYSLRKPPTLVAQICNYENPITCVSLVQNSYGPEVTVLPLDERGNFIKSSFSFIAVSND